MSSNPEPLATSPDGPLSGPSRREPRHETTRLVEYTSFPRVGADAEPHAGFTRNLSTSGMCVAGERPEPEGALLLVTLQDLAGRSLEPCVARVVWCRPVSEELFCFGLERMPAAGPG